MQNIFITDLQTQIENIYNTKDFERLINELFSRIYGTDFIPTDYHGDAGCDGYISSSKTLIAKHCFENILPRKANRTEEILKKARADLTKAKELSNKIPIINWMFITPYLIPTEILVTIKSEAKQFGFELKSPGPSYIASELIKNKDLIQSFPFLHIDQIDESLKSVIDKLDDVISNKQIDQTDKIIEKSSKPSLEKVLAKEQRQQQSSNLFKSQTKNKMSKDYVRLLQIMNQTPSLDLEKEVKSIIYSSVDPEAVLQGVHILVAWYKFSKNTADEIFTFIDLGIDTSRDIKSLDSEAILLAEKGFFKSTKFMLLDLEGWGRIRMSNTVGIPLITNEDKEAIVKELKKLNIEFIDLFNEAIRKAQASNNYLAITKSLMRIGSAAGLRAGHFISVKIFDRANSEKGLCKSSYLYAKKVAAKYKDEKEIAYILNNFANALGAMDETDEALLVLNEATRLAKKHKMNDILVNTKELERLIKEPIVKLG